MNDAELQKHIYKHQPFFSPKELAQIIHNSSNFKFATNLCNFLFKPLKKQLLVFCVWLRAFLSSVLTASHATNSCRNAPPKNSTVTKAVAKMSSCTGASRL